MTAKTLFRLTPLALLLAAAGNAQAAGFLDDSKTSLRYSQFYWNEGTRGAPDAQRDEWVQGAQFSFKSGYFNDLIGFDFGYGLANDLHIGDKANSLGNLVADQRDVQNPHGLGKPLEAYLKTRFADDRQELRFGAGKKARVFEQYVDSVTRVLPAATLGYDLDYRRGPLNLRLSQIEQFTPRNDNGWGDELTNFAGEKIDHLRILGASYALTPNTRLVAEHAEAKDYLESRLLRLEPNIPLDTQRRVELYASHGSQRDAGELFDYAGVPGLYEASDRHHARFVDLGATYRDGNWYAGLNLNQVRGDDFDRLFFAKDHGTWANSGQLFFWYGLEDERMLKLRGGLDFAPFGLPQLRWDGHYAVSDGAAGMDGFARREWQSMFQYRFDGALKGLHLIWLHTEHRTAGTPDGVRRTSTGFGPAAPVDYDADRLYLNYTYDF